MSLDLSFSQYAALLSAGDDGSVAGHMTMLRSLHDRGLITIEANGRGRLTEEGRAVVDDLREAASES